MNNLQLNYLRNNTKELLNDIPLLNWLNKLDSFYLLEIRHNLKLNSIKNIELKNYISFIVKLRK